MGFRFLAWIIPLTSYLAIAQTPTRIGCKHNPALCEIEIGGQTLTFGMPKSDALVVLSRTSYNLDENRSWSDEHRSSTPAFGGRLRQVVLQCTQISDLAVGKFGH